MDLKKNIKTTKGFIILLISFVFKVVGFTTFLFLLGISYIIRGIVWSIRTIWIEEWLG